MLSSADMNKLAGSETILSVLSFARACVAATPAPTVITPVPTAVPFLSGNARELVNSTNAAVPGYQEPTSLLPILSALAALAVCAVFTAHAGFGSGV